MSPPVPARRIRQVTARIARLQASLAAAYAERRALMRVQASTMTRRAIGEAWGVSNVTVTTAINRTEKGI